MSVILINPRRQRTLKFRKTSKLISLSTHINFYLLRPGLLVKGLDEKKIKYISMVDLCVAYSVNIRPQGQWIP